MTPSARIPDNIKKVLKDLQKIAPCIVAGGAIRDTLNGRAIKDVDVFMDSAYEQAFKRSVNYQQWRKLGKQDTEYKLANVVKDVYETNYGYDWPVQVIFCSIDPEEYVTRYFDFGLCKAWYDGSHIHCHKDFVKDVNNKTITMCLDEKAMNRAYPNVEYALKHIKQHGERIRYKYPSFSLVMPESEATGLKTPLPAI